MSNAEVWVPVKHFEGFYEVSSHGRVRSLTVQRDHGGYRPRWIPGRVLAFNGKYGKLNLYGADGLRREIRHHILVAEHFIPNPQRFPNVCHLDDNQRNCHTSNLYWGSDADNGADRARNGIAWRKLTPEALEELRRILAVTDPGKQRRPAKQMQTLAHEFGVSKATLNLIDRRKVRRHV